MDFLEEFVYMFCGSRFALLTLHLHMLTSDWLLQTLGAPRTPRRASFPRYQTRVRASSPLSTSRLVLTPDVTDIVSAVHTFAYASVATSCCAISPSRRACAHPLAGRHREPHACSHVLPIPTSAGRGCVVKFSLRLHFNCGLRRLLWSFRKAGGRCQGLRGCDQHARRSL